MSDSVENGPAFGSSLPPDEVFPSSSPPSVLGRAELARREIEAGDALSNRGQLLEAVDRFNHAVRLAPHEAQYHYKLAVTAWKAEQFGHVERHLREAARLEPQNAAAQEGLALWFFRENQLDRALQHINAALTLRPDSIQFAVTLADILRSSQREQAAWKVLAPLISAGICGSRLARIFALLAPKVGQEQRAIAYIQQALQVPGLVQPGDIPRLHFAAAHLLDQMGSYDDAFEQARLGNELSMREFDRSGYSQSVSARIDYYTRSRLKALPRATHGNRRPVLIVGMPRSGTSLVEQILASHPAVFGGGELSKLVDIALSALNAPWSQGLPFPVCSDHLSLKTVDDLAADYLSTIQSLNARATYVTDKMPKNFLLLGMVELLLPDIHVIHCMRDARDTCLSCYFTDFGTRHDFTFNLGDLASVYRDYRRVMAHWKNVLTLPILDVRYEDLVADQEGQTRRMLNFLALPWDDRCLAFHQNKRMVATASRDQVRRPLYASSVGRWKHYEKHIGELLALE